MIRGHRVYYPLLFNPTTAILTATGDGSGVATLSIQVSANTQVTISDNGNFYTDAAGTEGESKVWNVTSGALRTIYLKVTSGTAKLTFANRRLITHWGRAAAADGWLTPANAPSITFIDKLQIAFPNLEQLRISGTSYFNNELPVMLNYLNITAGINWIHNGILPPLINFLNMASNTINWTGFDLSGTANIVTFNLVNFVTTAMTSTQLIALLTSMAGRTGNLPATCTIGDYSEDPSLAAITAADPVVDGTAAEQIKYWINKVKTDKSVTTLKLNGTDY
jgi:hypothetical protein